MESVQVEIFGQVYSIKGMAEPDHIKMLAAYVDTKMKEIQKGTGTVDPHRVAILAALTITEELHRVRDHSREIENSTEQAVLRLLKITDGMNR